LVARTVRDQNLETRSARGRLKPSPKPYYRSIDPGLHLGYRKGKNGGRWVVRWYVGDQDYKTETIANADDVADADGVAILNFAQAQGVAREMRSRAARIAAGLPIDAGLYTVKQCINEYLAWVEHHRKGAKDARYRADALIVPRLGANECGKLTAGELRGWLRAIANSPARIRSRKGSEPRFRNLDNKDEDAVRRRRASANRTFTILKAALNMAWREGKIASDDAWRRVTPFEQVDSARVRYLQIDEARKLMDACDPEFGALVCTALVTGARFGELASLRVGDFNPDSGTVHVRVSKSGSGRHIVLTEEGIQHLNAACAGRAASAWLLVKRDGSKWLKSHQTRPMRDACFRAGITPPASFHALRHTYASLSVMAGAPLLVVARNLGHSDTRMVEKHYGHLAADYIAKEIRKAAPRFGMIPDDSKVAAIGGPGECR
jgi:integrase